MALHRGPIAARCSIKSRRFAFRRAESGSVATEYGLIAALVVVVVIVAIIQVRDSLLSLPFNQLIAAFNKALGG